MNEWKKDLPTNKKTVTARADPQNSKKPIWKFSISAFYNYSAVIDEKRAYIAIVR